MREITVGDERRIGRVSLGYAIADGEQGLDALLKLADANALGETIGAVAAASVRRAAGP
jgi:hypothetical protein